MSGTRQVSEKLNNNIVEIIPEGVEKIPYLWTQQETADILGWSVDKVKKHSQLKKVQTNTWGLIVQNINSQTGEVQNQTLFNVDVLLPIIPLTPEQQLNRLQGEIKHYSLYPLP